MPPRGNCAGLRDAVRKGNPSACPRSADVAALCAIIAWHDPAKCPPPGKSDKPGEGCVEQAKWAAALAEGKVAGLWPGDNSADQAMADALAGDGKGCKALIDVVRNKCIALATPPLPEEPHRPEDVPGTAPAVGPNKEGATPSPGGGLGGAPAAPGTPEPKPAPR